MDYRGVDDAGNVYENPAQLWEAVAARRAAATTAAAKKAKTTPSPTSEEKEDGPVWYKAAVDYWDGQEASVNGVLGGYGFVSDVDIRDSKAFVMKAMGPALEEAAEGKRQMVALDCGAGVGRVSEFLLLHHFQEVDLVEPSAHLLEAAKKNLCTPGTKKPFPAAHRAVGFFQMGLEEFLPEQGRYDAVWVQWAMMHLTDDDAVAFLQRCAAAMRPGGIIFIKENVCGQGFIVDSEDASVTRSHAYNLELYTEKAGLTLAHTGLQREFPKQLYKVRMYALKKSE